MLCIRDLPDFRIWKLHDWERRKEGRNKGDSGGSCSSWAEGRTVTCAQRRVTLNNIPLGIRKLCLGGWRGLDRQIQETSGPLSAASTWPCLHLRGWGGACSWIQSAAQPSLIACFRVRVSQAYEGAASLNKEIYNVLQQPSQACKQQVNLPVLFRAKSGPDSTWDNLEIG